MTDEIKTISQYSSTYTEPYKKTYVSCRAVTVKDDRILLSHESETGFYMSPGGGLEENETAEECVKRELREEAGYIVDVISPFVTVNEYCYDTLYISRYFLCEVRDTCERQLTETEKAKGMVPAWLTIDEAKAVFATYAQHTPDKESLYRRELTILNEYTK